VEAERKARNERYTVLVALVNRDPPMASNMVDVIAEILPPQAGN